MIDLRRRRIEPRVGQLDASILDSELLSMLKNQLWEVFKTYRPEIKDKYESELGLLLKLALFKLTVWDHSTTYGAKLQNLRFVDTRSRANSPISVYQKVGYGVLVVGGGYLWQKIEDYLARASYSSSDTAMVDRIRTVVDMLTSIWSFSTLANFVIFLFNGKYSTLVLRILRMRLASTTRQVNKQVNFEFQNRQLVWNAFTEFLLFILPLLNLPKLKRTAVRFLSGSPKNNESEAELAFLPQKTCAICYKQDADNDIITNGYQGDSCGHVYCYICLKSKLGEVDGEGWNCLRCGSLIKECKPFRDVDDSDLVDVSELNKEGGKEDAEKKKKKIVPPTQSEEANEEEEKPKPPPPPHDEPQEIDDDDNDTESDEDEGGGGFIIEDEY